MIPSLLRPLDALPLTANGKVDRRALPSPEQLRSEPSNRYEAPRDRLEVQLAQIWEELFGVRPIGVTDNFFDLGGHSLLAIRLFAEIERGLGRTLPVALLFEAPTVEQLASRLREEGWDGSLSSIVPIQPQGRKRPFFVVHGVGGNVLSYSTLARHLGPEQPVYGLQSRGVDGRTAQLVSLEEMATRYIAELRRIQPEGPYALGGHSYGGIVAFEMARQLHIQGQRIALLAILDSDTPTEPDRSDLLKRLLGHLNVLRRFNTRDKLAYLTSRTRAVVRKRLRRLQWQIIHAFARRLKRPLPQQCQDVEQLNLQALAEYEPRPYPGRLVLFRAGERWVEGASDPAEEWAKLALGGVDIVDVPGDHLTILQEPQVQTLARKLRIWLEQGHETRRSDRAGQGLRARRGGSSRALRARLFSLFLGSLFLL
jgi:aspartate racemase